jgi:hypothetical protein
MALKTMFAVCTLLSFRLLRAAALIPNNVAAFTCSSGMRAHLTRSYELRHCATFQLQTQSKKRKSSQLLRLMKVGAHDKRENIGGEDIESMYDIDADLANQIKDALSSAGMVDDSNREGKDAIQIFRNNRTSVASDRSMSVERSEKIIIRPPIWNKAPQYNYVELPPHTALAQVLANQYGIDLASVSPSSEEPGAKITAEDVEYHAWKVSQPPCTPEALAMAYSMGLDLNGLYDDDEREYVMGTADIQLYVENSLSLKMSTQVVKRGANIEDNNSESSKKRMKKKRALDRRIKQNVGKLSDKTMRLVKTLTGGILQQVHLQMQNTQRNTSSEKVVSSKGVLVDTMGKKSADDVLSIEDFDVDLANEIQGALSSAGESSPSVVGYNYMEKELQSMTCAQLKERLRLRGMKVSGKKSDLVYRLLLGCEDDGVIAQNESGEGDVNGDGNIDNVPFFATMQ